MACKGCCHHERAKAFVIGRRLPVKGEGYVPMCPPAPSGLITHLGLGRQCIPRYGWVSPKWLLCAYTTGSRDYQGLSRHSWTHWWKHRESG
jgi:hypothetical protein